MTLVIGGRERRGGQAIVELALRPAASHDILDFKRCSCNALKPKSILSVPQPSPAA